MFCCSVVLLSASSFQPTTPTCNCNVYADAQITKKMIRVNKAVRHRRTWSKFGDCDGQEVRVF